MYRFLLSRRWLGLFAVAAVLVVAFVFLGLWQLGRFETGSGGTFLPHSGSSAPATPAPAPSSGQRQLQTSDGGSLQNLSYAFQWWAFAVALVVLGLRTIRMEARERAGVSPEPRVERTPRRRRRAPDDDEDYTDVDDLSAERRARAERDAAAGREAAAGRDGSAAR